MRSLWVLPVSPICCPASRSPTLTHTPLPGALCSGRVLATCHFHAPLTQPEGSSYVCTHQGHCCHPQPHPRPGTHCSALTLLSLHLWPLGHTGSVPLVASFSHHTVPSAPTTLSRTHPCQLAFRPHHRFDVLGSPGLTPSLGQGSLGTPSALTRQLPRCPLDTVLSGHLPAGPRSPGHACQTHGVCGLNG